jgi:hypothetical protein
VFHRIVVLVCAEHAAEITTVEYPGTLEYPKVRLSTLEDYSVSTSAPGTGLPHLRRDYFHPCHICAEAGLIPATHQRLGSPLPFLP